MEEKCRGCKSSDLIRLDDEGEIVCRNCGLVTGYPIYDTREAFIDHEKTPVSSLWGVSYERETGSQMIKKLEQICFKNDNNSSNIKNNIMCNIFRELSQQLGLTSQLIDYGCKTIEDLNETGKLPTRRKFDDKIICAAVLYRVCHDHNVSRTFDEIARAGRIEKMDISRAYSLMRKRELFPLHTTSRSWSSAKPSSSIIQNNTQTEEKKEEPSSKRLKLTPSILSPVMKTCPVNQMRNVIKDEKEEEEDHSNVISSLITLPQEIIPRFCQQLKIKKSCEVLSISISKLLINSGLLEGKVLKLQVGLCIYYALLLYPKIKVNKNDIIKSCSLSSSAFNSGFEIISKHWRVLLPSDIQLKVGEQTLIDVYGND